MLLKDWVRDVDRPTDINFAIAATSEVFLSHGYVARGKPRWAELALLVKAPLWEGAWAKLRSPAAAHRISIFYSATRRAAGIVYNGEWERYRQSCTGVRGPSASGNSPMLCRRYAFPGSQRPASAKPATSVSICLDADATAIAAAAGAARDPEWNLTLLLFAGMAISGGVDSMALAFLCARLRSFEPRLRVSDHPVSRFRAVIVDHGLRDGSTAEAEAVRAAVQAMGHIATVCAVNWKRYFRRWGLGNISPNSLSNVESLARKLRYRTLASELLSVKTGSLLLAHHADDQYETALMRLVSGHGVRGLRGMRPANDIPESYDMYNVYQSGFLDDQMYKYPLYNMIPTKRHRKYARAELQHEMDPEVLERELAAGLPTLDEDLDEPLRRSRAAPPLAPLDTEDGGIMIYRPLLEFSKERLVATCVENKVPWFEDHTNRDPTLTLRNALRHLYQNHELPIALQKPAILQLVARCVKRTAAEDAEADRLLSRTVIRQFVTNTGTMVVQIPQLRPCSRRSGSIYSAASIRRRREHYRTIAALLIQKLLGFVTPETQTTPISGLQTVVTRLVPTLQEEGGSSSAEPPKAYTICSVLFAPVTIKESNVIHRHLSRAPYPSRNHAELPVNWFRSLPRGARRGVRVSKWKWPEWSKWRQFDGRFWVRVRIRLPFVFALVPLQS